MKTPVLVAAHNEAHTISNLLSTLDATVCEPLVIVNGSTDGTDEIARSFGVGVINRDEQGKLPAIQEGLRHLGSRALGPVLYIDADSYPKRPSEWVTHMTEAACEDLSIPTAVAGRLALTGADPVSNALRTAKQHYRFYRDTRVDPMNTVSGANMATRFHSTEVLDKVLGLPHIWPSEDRVIARTIIDSGGNLVLEGRAGAVVATSSRYIKPLIYKLIGQGGALISHEKRRPAHVEPVLLDDAYRLVSS